MPDRDPFTEDVKTALWMVVAIVAGAAAMWLLLSMDEAYGTKHIFDYTGTWTGHAVAQVIYDDAPLAGNEFAVERPHLDTTFTIAKQGIRSVMMNASVFGLVQERLIGFVYDEMVEGHINGIKVLVYPLHAYDTHGRVGVKIWGKFRGFPERSFILGGVFERVENEKTYKSH